MDLAFDTPQNIDTGVFFLFLKYGPIIALPHDLLGQHLSIDVTGTDAVMSFFQASLSSTHLRRTPLYEYRYKIPPL